MEIRLVSSIHAVVLEIRLVSVWSDTSYTIDKYWKGAKRLDKDVDQKGAKRSNWDGVKHETGTNAAKTGTDLLEYWTYRW